MPDSPTHPESLEERAQAAYQHGRMAEAAELLHRAIAITPRSVSLLANLGITLVALGRLDEAIGALREALAIDPANPMILTNLAAALKDRGLIEDAIATYRQAIAIQPANPQTHHHLATVLKDKGDLQAAIDEYRQAVSLAPSSVYAHAFLGHCLYAARQYEQAIDAYQRALALHPNYPEGYSNLSICYCELGRLDEAIASARQALALKPDFPEAWYHLGRALSEQRKPDEAIEAYRQALRLRPEYVEAGNNLAILLDEQGLPHEAIDLLGRVLAIKPDFIDAQCTLGIALKDIGRFDEAIAVLEKALAADPQHHATRGNLAMSLLLKGDFERGWPAYEARRKIPKLSSTREFPQPQWHGEPLSGRRILLHPEQGFGDAIQFIRYASVVRERGGRVIVLCPVPLRRLFEGQLGIEQVIIDAEPLPAFDLHCPLLSLPHVLHTTIETIPAEVPYLSAPQDLVEQWRDRISNLQSEISNLKSDLKVGLVWAGSPGHKHDRQRSISLSALAPLAAIPGVQFFSLQKGPRDEEPKSALPGMNLIDLTSQLTDFAETAALICNLDLVISADTAVAHLAGALGKKVRLLLPFVPDWRWMLDRSDSPWYPTMWLFRQTRPGDWDGPVKQVAEELALLVR